MSSGIFCLCISPCWNRQIIKNIKQKIRKNTFIVLLWPTLSLSQLLAVLINIMLFTPNQVMVHPPVQMSDKGLLCQIVPPLLSRIPHSGRTVLTVITADKSSLHHLSVKGGRARKSKLSRTLPGIKQAVKLRVHRLALFLLLTKIIGSARPGNLDSNLSDSELFFDCNHSLFKSVNLKSCSFLKDT